MKDYLKAKKLLEGCSAKLGESVSRLSNNSTLPDHSGSADSPLRPSSSRHSTRRLSRRSQPPHIPKHRDVVIGQSTLSSDVLSETIDPFSSLDAVNGAADLVSEQPAFNSYNEPITDAAPAHRAVSSPAVDAVDLTESQPSSSSSTGDRTEESIDYDLSAYFDASEVEASPELTSEVVAETFDIIDETDESEGWIAWEIDELEASHGIDHNYQSPVSEETLIEDGTSSEVLPHVAHSHEPAALRTSDHVVCDDYDDYDAPIDWGVDPKDSLLIDPNDFAEVSADAHEASATSAKPRYRYQPQTQEYTSLGDPVSSDKYNEHGDDEVFFSDAMESASLLPSAPERSAVIEEDSYLYADEEEALIGFSPEEPQLTIIQSSLTEKASPQAKFTAANGDAPDAVAKPKPVLFPVRKIDWDNFPIKAHHFDQAGKATLSGASALGSVLKPLPRQAAGMLARPSMRAAQMAKRALQRRSELAVQRLVQSVERSKDSALKTIKDNFDLNQPCTGEFDREGLGYNQAYISEHNFKSIVQLSSFSILIMLCVSFTVNLWMNDEHGFGFRQQIIRDLAMINAETTAIEQENTELNRQIETLRHDDEAVESMVRYELGMIKPDETFIRIVN